MDISIFSAWQWCDASESVWDITQKGYVRN